MSEKKALREEAHAVRATIPAAARAEKSAAILDRLRSMPEIQEANDVFCFVSFRNEVNTHPILEYLLQQGKRVYIPYIHEKNRNMRASELRSFTELERGFFGVLEHKNEFVRLTDIDAIDLVITPGLFFDLEGYRVGYGGGFFDGFFASFTTPVNKIGICFQEQIRDELPRASHDIPVDWIVTDERTYHPAGARSKSTQSQRVKRL